MIKTISHVINVVHNTVRELAKKHARSPHWRSVEKKHLATHPTCIACGSRKHLNVHHIKPFHLHPELELEPSNLCTLCMGPFECHLKIGHSGSFKADNPDVIRDAKEILEQPQKRPLIEQRAKVSRKT